MYNSVAKANSGARPKKKKRNEPSPLAQATFTAFEPFIYIFDPGLKLSNREIIHTISAEDWKLNDRYKAGEKTVFHQDGRRFHPYLDIIRNIYGPEHVHRHIEKNEVSYYTSGRNGLGLLYLDEDAHHPWQTDEAEGRDLLERLFPFGYYRHSTRGQNGYLKVRYSSIAEYNEVADRLEYALKRLFLHSEILCDIEVKGTITDSGKSGRLAKLPFSTRYGPELLHRATWAPHELELLKTTEDWCFHRLEQFKSTPIVNVQRLARITEQIEAMIDEEKVSRFLKHKDAVKKEYERQAEEEERVREQAREEALAKRRAMSFSGLPLSSTRPVTNDDRDINHAPARNVVPRKPSKPFTPPSEPGRSEGDAFTRNWDDLLPFVRQFYKRAGRFPDVEDVLIHLRDNGLFSGQWEENEGRRETRVGQILGVIESGFDPKELSSGESKPVDLRLGKFSWWVRRQFGSGIRFTTADVRRFDPVSMTGPVMESMIPARFIETFLVVADFCLNEDPLDNKAVPTSRFKKLWPMVEGGAPWNQRYFQIVRDRLDRMGVVRIVDRNHRKGKAWRWEAGSSFPSESWKAEQQKLKEQCRGLRLGQTYEEFIADISIETNNNLHNSLYHSAEVISGFSAPKFAIRPPPT